MSISELVKRDGHYYKEFTDVPFTGTTTGKKQGTIRNGKKKVLGLNTTTTGSYFGKEPSRTVKTPGPIDR